MRIIVFFDLPTTTYYDRKVYQHFRKQLIKDGFIMMQESVYCKLALNNSIVKSEMAKLEKIKPLKGLVFALVVTEKQFSQIKYLTGNKQNDTEDSESRLLIL
jgi:CRISPR-associated protein Cas2